MYWDLKRRYLYTHAKCRKAKEQHKEVDKVAEEHESIDIGSQSGFVHQTEEELMQR